jgi:hypothetical protein
MEMDEIGVLQIHVDFAFPDTCQLGPAPPSPTPEPPEAGPSTSTSRLHQGTVSDIPQGAFLTLHWVGRKGKSAVELIVVERVLP